MAFVPTVISWSPEHQTQRLQVTRKQLETEEQSAFPLGRASPHHLYQGHERLQEVSVRVSMCGCFDVEKELRMCLSRCVSLAGLGMTPLAQIIGHVDHKLISPAGIRRPVRWTSSPPTPHTLSLKP